MSPRAATPKQIQDELRDAVRAGRQPISKQKTARHKTPPGKRAGPGAKEPLYLDEWDWAPMVKKGFFQGILTGYVGAGLGLIFFEARGMVAPDWLLINVWLSVLCAVVAFARVWKTIREENETSTLWDDIEVDRVADRVVEIPYLFSITVLPFASIAPQAFMVILLLFYLTDNYYNCALILGIAAKVEGTPARTLSGWEAFRGSWLLTWGIGGGERAGEDVLITYFRKRSHWNTRFLRVLSIAVITQLALAIVVWQVDLGWSRAAEALMGITALLALALILFFEVFREPRRNAIEGLWPPDEPSTK